MGTPQICAARRVSSSKPSSAGVSSTWYFCKALSLFASASASLLGFIAGRQQSALGSSGQNVHQQIFPINQRLPLPGQAPVLTDFRAIRKVATRKHLHLIILHRILRGDMVETV